MATDHLKLAYRSQFVGAAIIGAGSALYLVIHGTTDPKFVPMAIGAVIFEIALGGYWWKVLPADETQAALPTQQDSPAVVRSAEEYSSRRTQ